MREILHTTLAAMIILAVAATALRADSGDGDCIPDWSVAAPIVRQQGLVSVEVLAEMAASRIEGEIVKTTLCREEGAYVYRLVIKDERGRFRRITLDARRPFGR